MRIFQPLRERSIALVFGSQVFSSMGDELNRVAVVWLGTGLWGAGAGYLLALHAACAFVCSLLGGRVAERFDARRTLIVADIVRGLAVLSIPVGVTAGLPVQPLLLGATATCASFSAFFDPALRSSLPTLVTSRELLHATNALMESTMRFARVLGPGLVALLGPLIPPIHLFTLDAATFAISALAIAKVSAQRFAGAAVHAATHERDEGGGLRAVLRLVSRTPVIRYIVISGAWVSAAWTFVLPLGFGLLVRERTPQDLSALGAVLTAYGVGNVASNVLIPSFNVRAESLMFGGRLMAGLGFLAFALAPSTPLMWAAAAFAAAGGPATDVGFLSLLQARYDARSLARVYRLNLAASYGMMVLMFFLSPWLVKAVGVATLIELCALVLIAAGVIGLVRFGSRQGSPATPSGGG